MAKTVDYADRRPRVTVTITGARSSGKSVTAAVLRRALIVRGATCEVQDDRDPERDVTGNLDMHVKIVVKNS